MRFARLGLLSRHTTHPMRAEIAVGGTQPKAVCALLCVPLVACCLLQSRCRFIAYKAAAHQVVEKFVVLAKDELSEEIWEALEETAPWQQEAQRMAAVEQV